MSFFCDRYLCNDILLEIYKHCSPVGKLCFSSTCKNIRKIYMESKINFFPFYQPWVKCKMYLEVQRLLFLLEETMSSSVAIYLLPPIKQISWSLMSNPKLIENLYQLPVYILNIRSTNGICQHIDKYFVKRSNIIVPVKRQSHNA